MRDKGVHGLAFVIGETGVFEISSKMQLLLDLVLVLEDAADPLLKKPRMKN